VRPARTLRAWVFRIVAALVSTTVALVAAEVAVRWLAVPEINPVWRGLYQLSDNEALCYELMPNAVDRDSTIGSDGLRDREYDAVKPLGTFRIAVVGDSIAYGVRVKQSETFSSQLERLLNRYYREPRSGSRF